MTIRLRPAGKSRETAVVLVMLTVEWGILAPFRNTLACIMLRKYKVAFVMDSCSVNVFAKYVARKFWSLSRPVGVVQMLGALTSSGSIPRHSYKWLPA